jgi:hypothetical protein
MTPQERNGAMLDSLWRIGEAIMRTNRIRYHKYSAYNFTASSFLAAAKRFLELREDLVREEAYDEERYHEDFVRCDSCERLEGLREQYNQFAVHFGYMWALKLVESAPPEKKPPASTMIECSVCRREVPKKEYYAEHINLHPCE